MTRVRPDTRGDYALNSIREDMVAGRLAAGDKVSAEQLADRLGVSHVPVREALRFLEAEGHLERDHRGRLRVRPTSADEADEIYLLRQILEEQVHEFAVPRLTDDDIAALRSELRKMDEAAAARDVEAFAKANRRFHFTVFERSERIWMLRFLTMIWDAAARYQTEVFLGSGWEAQLQEQHHQLFDAFRRREPSAVHVLMAEHRKLAVEAAHRRAVADGQPTPPVAGSGGVFL